MHYMHITNDQSCSLNILDFYSILAPDFIFLDIINIIYYNCTLSVSFIVQNVKRKKKYNIIVDYYLHRRQP